MSVVTAPQWLRTSVSAGRLARLVSGRDDVIATVYPLVPDHAPLCGDTPVAAWLHRPTARIHIIAGLLDESAQPGVDLYDVVSRLHHAALAGAVVHEGGHAAHTLWLDHLPEDVNPAHLDAARTLEESRIEARVISRRRMDAVLLRASGSRVVLSSLQDADSADLDTNALLTVLGLVLPRVDGRTFPARLVAPLRQLVVDEIGESAVDEFSVIWRDALATEDEDAATMLDCGRRWTEAVAKYFPTPEQPQGDKGDEGEDQASGGGHGGIGPHGGATPGDAEQQDDDNQSDDNQSDDNQSDDNQSDDSQSDEQRRLPSTGCAQTDGEESAPADFGTAESAGAGNHGDRDSGQQRDKGSTAEGQNAPQPSPAAVLVRGILLDISKEAQEEATQAAARCATAAQPSHPQIPAGDAAAQPQAPGLGIGVGAVDGYVVEFRPPTLDDHARNGQCTRILRAAQYRAPHRTRERAAAPGQRMRTTKLVQRTAQMRRSLPVTATPWARNRTQTVDRPPLTVGIVLDISASMESWAPHAAAAAWALAHAVDRLGGTAASLAFSGTVYQVLTPKAVPTNVPVIGGGGGGSNGCGACLAELNLQLHLSATRGARVVVVLTDGLLPDTNTVSARVRDLTRRGVVVVWALTHAEGWAPDGAHVVTNVQPETFPTLVTTACAQALAAVRPD